MVHIPKRDRNRISTFWTCLWVYFYLFLCMFSAVILRCISACNRWQIDITAELSNAAIIAERLERQFAFELWWKDLPDLRYLGQTVLQSKNKRSHQVIPQVLSTAHYMVFGSCSLLLLSKAKCLVFLTLVSFPTWFFKKRFLDKKMFFRQLFHLTGKRQGREACVIQNKPYMFTCSFVLYSRGVRRMCFVFK